VIASAVIPTLIANTWFLPKHLLPHKHPSEKPPLPAQSPATMEEGA